MAKYCQLIDLGEGYMSTYYSLHYYFNSILGVKFSKVKSWGVIEMALNYFKNVPRHTNWLAHSFISRGLPTHSHQSHTYLNTCKLLTLS